MAKHGQKKTKNKSGCNAKEILSFVNTLNPSSIVGSWCRTHTVPAVATKTANASQLALRSPSRPDHVEMIPDLQSKWVLMNANAIISFKISRERQLAVCVLFLYQEQKELLGDSEGSFIYL